MFTEVSLDQEIYDRFFARLGQSDEIHPTSLEKLHASLGDKKLPKPELLIELLGVLDCGGNK